MCVRVDVCVCRCMCAPHLLQIVADYMKLMGDRMDEEVGGWEVVFFFWGGGRWGTVMCRFST